MCVSRSISAEEGDRLAAVLGIYWVRCHEQYLGWLSFASNNKRSPFNDIKDRIWNKIRDWRCKLLSVGGKEILIKAMLQSIPAYSMTLFKLPTGLISEIHKLENRFLWGSMEAKRKVHWASRKKMCVRKVDGSLRFRDLAVFNQAMLAKKGWRLEKNPGSLAARVLCSCYCPKTNFMAAEEYSGCGLVYLEALNYWKNELAGG
ncbi:hypothetical protein Dsin_015902 [Dipteronia sinensis]|uniref:Uncharacterized protein n=1 Tax=Dipteronia sinensis TaxID=43782 RepID=A0AAE0AC26_9ROSI|nr:hypothetical protein Dsin_015902 [Dipteronia sinensis]